MTEKKSENKFKGKLTIEQGVDDWPVTYCVDHAEQLITDDEFADEIIRRWNLFEAMRKWFNDNTRNGAAQYCRDIDCGLYVIIAGETCGDKPAEKKPRPDHPAYLEPVREFLEGFGSDKLCEGCAARHNAAKALLAQLPSKTMTVGDMECGIKGKFAVDNADYIRISNWEPTPYDKGAGVNKTACVRVRTGEVKYFCPMTPVDADDE